jgi:hypothetical protein
MSVLNVSILRNFSRFDACIITKHNWELHFKSAAVLQIGRYVFTSLHLEEILRDTFFFHKSAHEKVNSTILNHGVLQIALGIYFWCQRIRREVQDILTFTR